MVAFVLEYANTILIYFSFGFSFWNHSLCNHVSKSKKRLDYWKKQLFGQNVLRGCALEIGNQKNLDKLFHSFQRERNLFGQHFTQHHVASCRFHCAKQLRGTKSAPSQKSPWRKFTRKIQGPAALYSGFFWGWWIRVEPCVPKRLPKPQPALSR